MKRLHVHISVADLDQSVTFYSTLFGADPDRHESDYAKWMLDDPGVNFVISARGGTPGLNHLGLQVDNDEDLTAIEHRLEAAGETVVGQTAARCCYAEGDKSWSQDPQGIAWETFHTHGSIEVFGTDGVPEAATAKPDTPGCCA